VRNLYPGRSGFQGIMAAHLSQCGYTAIADGPADLYRTFLGEGFDPEAVIDGLGSAGNLRIQQNYFKFHACCLYNHPVLDAVQDLLRDEPFVASDVKSIAVTAPPIAGIMADPHPENMLAAKFSIPYAVAAAICYGRTDVTAFLPERVDDADIRELAQRVTLASDPEMNLRRYDYPSARVAVQLRDGRVRRAEVTAQRGDFSNPAGREELLGKFDLLSRDTLGAGIVQQVVEAVSRLDRLSDVRELTALLSTG
jgi:2-methylcitrate dehydratase PrpD